jgi:hypothetical protein
MYQVGLARKWRGGKQGWRNPLRRNPLRRNPLKRNPLKRIPLMRIPPGPFLSRT